MKWLLIAALYRREIRAGWRRGHWAHKFCGMRLEYDDATGVLTGKF